MGKIKKSLIYDSPMYKKGDSWASTLVKIIFMTMVIFAVFLVFNPNYNMLLAKTRSLVTIATVQDEDIETFADIYGISSIANLNSNEKRQLVKNTVRDVQARVSDGQPLTCQDMGRMMGKLDMVGAVDVDITSVGEAYMEIAMCYAEEKNYEDAVAMLEKALSLPGLTDAAFVSRVKQQLLDMEQLRLDAA